MDSIDLTSLMELNSDLVIAAIVICLAGAVGGLVNCVVLGDLHVAPRQRRIAGSQVYRLGVIGNMVVGAAAAFITWALYGGNATTSIVASTGEEIIQPITLTLTALGGALLTGVGGARMSFTLSSGVKVCPNEIAVQTGQD